METCNGDFRGKVKKLRRLLCYSEKTLTESEASALSDHPSGNNKLEGKPAVFSRLFKRTPKMWTSLPAQEEGFTNVTVFPKETEELSLQNEAGNCIQTENGNKEGPVFKNKDFSESNTDLSYNVTEEGNSLCSFLKSFPRGTEVFFEEDSPPLHIKLLASNEHLLYPSCTSSKDKSGKPRGSFRTSPKPVLRLAAETDPLSEQSELEDWDYSFSDNEKTMSFRVKRTLPTVSLLPSNAQVSDQDVNQKPMEMEQLQTTENSTFEIVHLKMAPYPTDFNTVEPEEDDDLMDWWKTVEGWSEWNEVANLKQDKDELALEAAADRVFMAARLFVSLFNQRGASLQRRIVDLLALADTADSFHKKTVSAAVGGGVASVAGGIATITGLILAPFTFGTSTIVTAVGISVATAGSLTSATANITDALQSKMDRKKVEKMIQGYQDEINDIRDCLEFMQEGMNALQEWDFKAYSESVVKTSLNRNIKYVMKEGGRAGRALMINTDRLVSTIKVLGVAGGAAKAARAISVTTGVMSTLFLALDVFFLAKDSNELRKGAKTKFASKIRDVCKELQNGLLELNKVKTQLQKIMDGIEVEEYEEEDEDQDPVELALLEQELDQMEEELDQKTMHEQLNKSKKREVEKESTS